MKNPRLTSNEKRFFRLLANFMAANPFSEERWPLEQQLGQGHSNQVEQAFPEAFEEIQKFEEKGRYNVQLYQGEARELVYELLFFDFHHRFRDKFLKHIRAQEETDEPLTVDFAHEAMQYLVVHGYTPEEAKFYFEISYQARRSFHFIADALVGWSPSMIQMRAQLWQNVFSYNYRWYSFLYQKMEDFSTLILGETGSGKDTAAKAIGRSCYIPFDVQKGRFYESFRKAFVSINLSQFPTELVESELFGHKKGAFTGALGNHDGVFQTCSPHGAIFLDEIGEVSEPLQIKLLQVLQGRVFTPVGSHDKLRFQGRVIAATNKPIQELRQKGAFRDDFYYRLCSNEIVIPPLRVRLQERPDELQELLAFIIERIAGQPLPGANEHISQVIQKELGEKYSWPGNVRELEQCVRRILLTNACQSSTLQHDDVMLSEQIALEMMAGTYSAQDLLSEYSRLLYRKLRSYEAVARQLGIDRRTVKKYIQRRDISL